MQPDLRRTDIGENGTAAPQNDPVCAFYGRRTRLVGLKAYLTQHRNEWKDHIAAVVSDSGQGKIAEAHLGRTEVVAVFTPFAAELKSLREIKVNDRAEFGTDTGPFVLAGMPGINLEQDSPDYQLTHHSAADTLEAAKPDALALNATIMAMTCFWLAERPERFAEPWPPGKQRACCGNRARTNS